MCSDLGVQLISHASCVAAAVISVFLGGFCCQDLFAGAAVVVLVWDHIAVRHLLPFWQRDCFAIGGCCSGSGLLVVKLAFEGCCCWCSDCAALVLVILLSMLYAAVSCWVLLCAVVRSGEPGEGSRQWCMFKTLHKVMQWWLHKYHHQTSGKLVVWKFWGFWKVNFVFSGWPEVNDQPHGEKMCKNPVDVHISCKQPENIRHQKAVRLKNHLCMIQVFALTWNQTMLTVGTSLT